MNNLVLITNSYPQKGKEGFLHLEVPILAKNFDKIFLLPLNSGGESHAVPSNVIVDNLFCRDVGKSKKLNALLKLGFPFLKMFFSEKRKTKSNISLMFKLGALALRLKTFIKEENLKNSNTLFYSYWLDEGAAILSILKENDSSVKAISRAHGYDLYEEDYPQGLPFFYKFSINRLNQIFFISKNGKEYFQSKYNLNSDKLKVSYLGTRNTEIGPAPSANKPYKIASCSSMVSLKRLDLLANALSNMEIDIEWHHFGDGPMKNELEEIIKGSENCSAKFHGHVSNEDLMKHYAKNDFHLFVNVSRTEGLPVSLIEAASFGIPLLATDVRGSGEICNENTGVLIPADCNISLLQNEIRRALGVDWDRNSIRQFWLDNFQAKSNFEDFAAKIQGI